MFEHLFDIQETLHLSDDEVKVIQLATWFHDVIYNPQSHRPGENELRSCILFDSFADEIELVRYL